MPIDNRDKRAAIPGIGRPFLRGKNISGAKDFAWRCSTGLSYGGNLFAPTTGAFVLTLSSVQIDSIQFTSLQMDDVLTTNQIDSQQFEVIQI